MNKITKYFNTDAGLVECDQAIYDAYKAHTDVFVTIEAGKSVSPSDKSRRMYWMWMDQLAKFFTKEMNSDYDKDDMHNLMRHKFLGYEDKQIGNTQITRQLRSTARGKIKDSEFYYYMSELDAWSANYGCLLKRLSDSAYEQWSKENR